MAYANSLISPLPQAKRRLAARQPYEMALCVVE
jgi:hypothetical protein